jgi:hypothetical protein
LAVTTSVAAEDEPKDPCVAAIAGGAEIETKVMAAKRRAFITTPKVKSMWMEIFRKGVR